jgi:hypothetical protein
VVPVPAPELLPRVGGTLRLGPPYDRTTVDLSWTTDRPLDLPAGEHVHVLRSRRPDSGFAAITLDAPRLVAERFTDADSSLPGGPGVAVHHYLVFTADGCENDNADFDRP